MRILILSRSPWDDTNSLGNTLSNLFSSISSEKIAHLYLRSTNPSNNVCTKYFRINDKDVLMTLFRRNLDIGTYFEMQQNKSNLEYVLDTKTDEKLYSFFRNKSSKIALFGQELLWHLGRWNSELLKNFLNEFKPDVIFAPAFSTPYVHRLLWYIKEEVGVKIVLFHADDYLSTNKSKGLIDSVYNKMRFKAIIKSTNLADINYCISTLQQEEYQKKIGKEMKLLHKGANFSNQPDYSLPKEDEPIKIIYVGSVLYGRWKTLSILAEEISKINKVKNKFMLVIYSQYTLTKEMKERMIIEGASIFKGKIPSNQVKDTLMSADIVLHLESFDDVEKEKTRLSFSTKIVDCLNSGRALMAIGWDRAASIDYLIKNDAALVATDADNISNLLNEIQLNSNILKEYADKAWMCGKKNHQIDEIQKNLYQELSSLVKEVKNESIAD